MSVLRWNSTQPASASSGHASVPSHAAAVPGVQVTLGDCPHGQGARRLNATITLRFGPTEPPVRMSLTVDGEPHGGALDFERVGDSSEWRATAHLGRNMREGQTVGLRWSGTGGATSVGDVTLSVVATDWGDID